jgi:hypothetical protein
MLFSTLLLYLVLIFELVGELNITNTRRSSDSRVLKTYKDVLIFLNLHIAIPQNRNGLITDSINNILS